MNLEMGLEQAPNDGRSDAIDAAGMRHTPRMSAERAERIRQWHDAAYEAAKSDGAQERGFDYLGITVTIRGGAQVNAALGGLISHTTATTDKSRLPQCW
jgi:hypothetical protein